MTRNAFIMAAMVSLCPLSLAAQDTGADAFANRDFATAQQLWQQEANAGSAEAMLGLGLLADRGYGGQRNLDEAFDWYTKAADLGLAEAQFNIAIMYDAGLGRPRDAQEAVIWYTRAALRDHSRAQYNLGLLYESGDGIAANADLAAYWFEKAAAFVPAAAEKPAIQVTATDQIAAPNLTFAQNGVQGAEAVWTAPSGTSPDFLVEMLQVPMPDHDYAMPLLSERTNASGLLEEVDESASQVIWRVSNIMASRRDYDASDWVTDANTTPPKGRITFLVDARVPQMVQAATIFADDLRADGYWVRLDQDTRTAFDDFYVSYGFTSDAWLANTVASYLPRVTNLTVNEQVVDATQPGEIVINLAAFR